MRKLFPLTVSLFVWSILFFSCNSMGGVKPIIPDSATRTDDGPDYFQLRPTVEKNFGYSHAVRIGKEIKISGAVSMDSAGVPLAKGDMLQQMKNCYSDLDKILRHYGCSFDDVVVENIFTMNMRDLEKVSSYRNSIYKKQFPTGTWVEVMQLAYPDFLIEIELEAHISK
jgi:2-iminobutanoate/2-iminopropanoate deaminase